jgi:thioredoxin:protein disulfide reductase
VSINPLACDGAASGPQPLAALSGGTRARRARLPLLWLTGLAAVALLLVPSSALAEQQKDAFTRAMEYGGPVVAAVVAFGFGLATCVTPCVYPMIVITVSIFGARQATSRREAVLLSASFVLGIVVLYTVMLVVAALTGGLFGAALANRWVNLGLATLFFVLAAAMFGAFEMTLPESAMQRLSTVGGIGYGGAFGLGLVLSLVAAPCVGPVASGIILYIAQRQNVLLGAGMGASFALGLGLPFFLVGAFAMSLPKGGKWMLWVKSFFGIVLCGVGLYFLRIPVPWLLSLARPGTAFLLAAGAALVVGLALGAVHVSWDDGGALVKARKALGIVLTIGGGFLLWAGSSAPDASASAGGAKPLVWEQSETAALAKARAEKRPLIIDFTADWCGACQEFAHQTFGDPRVRAKTANYVALKVDATSDEDPQIDAVKRKYKVMGLPTVLIYDSTGAERKRFNEFVKPEPFLAEIEGID